MSRRAISPRLRFQVFARDKFTCRYCGLRSAPAHELQVDHIHPVSKGGRHHIDNFATACRICNAGKGADVLPVRGSYQEREAFVSELFDCLEEDVGHPLDRSEFARRAASAAIAEYGIDIVIVAMLEVSDIIGRSPESQAEVFGRIIPIVHARKDAERAVIDAWLADDEKRAALEGLARFGGFDLPVAA